MQEQGRGVGGHGLESARSVLRPGADVLILHDKGDIDVNNGFHACSS